MPATHLTSSIYNRTTPKHKSLSVTKYIAFALLSLSIILPSGSVYGLNLKIMLSLLCATALAIKIKRSKAPKGIIKYPLLAATFLLCYSLIAASNEIPEQQIASHAVAFASLFAIIYIPLTLISIKTTNTQSILKIIIVSLGAFSAFKIFISATIHSGLNPIEVKAYLEDIFRTSFIGLETGLFYRVHLPADYLLPISIYLVIQKNTPINIAQPTKKLLLLLFIAAAIVSYSRLIYLLSALSIFFGLTSSQNKGGSIIKLMLLPLLIATYAAFSNSGSITSFITERYSGESAVSSDATRSAMLYALLNNISENPILGRGLGAGARGYTNIENVPWYFELQWLSFAMQFGLLGFIALLLTALTPTKNLLKQINIHKASILILYVLWLGVGAFNGFMLTSAGGVVFLAFICAADSKKHQYHT